MNKLRKGLEAVGLSVESVYPNPNDDTTTIVVLKDKVLEVKHLQFLERHHYFNCLEVTDDGHFRLFFE